MMLCAADELLHLYLNSYVAFVVVYNISCYTQVLSMKNTS